MRPEDLPCLVGSTRRTSKISLVAVVVPQPKERDLLRPPWDLLPGQPPHAVDLVQTT